MRVYQEFLRSLIFLAHTAIIGLSVLVCGVNVLQRTHLGLESGSEVKSI